MSKTESNRTVCRKRFSRSSAKAYLVDQLRTNCLSHSFILVRFLFRVAKTAARYLLSVKSYSQNCKVSWILQWVVVSTMKRSPDCDIPYESTRKKNDSITSSNSQLDVVELTIDCLGRRKEKNVGWCLKRIVVTAEVHCKEERIVPDIVSSW